MSEKILSRDDTAVAKVISPIHHYHEANALVTTVNIAMPILFSRRHYSHDDTIVKILLWTILLACRFQAPSPLPDASVRSILPFTYTLVIHNYKCSSLS